MKSLLKDNLIVFVSCLLIFFYCVIFNNTTGWNLFFLVVPLILFSVTLTMFKTTTKLKSNNIETHSNESIRFEITIDPFPFKVLCNFSAELTVNGKVYGNHKLDKRHTSVVFCFRNVLKRGTYKDVSLTIYKKDIFSLIKRKISQYQNLQIEIFPALIKEIDIDFLESLRLLSHTQSLYSESSNHEIKDLKEYQIGMPVKNIYWKAFSKSGEIVVRNFDSTRQNQVQLLMHTQKSINFERVLSVFYSIAVQNNTLFSNVKVNGEALIPSIDKRRFLKLKPSDEDAYHIPSHAVIVTSEVIKSDNLGLIQVFVSDDHVAILDAQGNKMNNEFMLKEDAHAQFID